MTEIELKNLIKNQESQTLEFKESTGEKREICETICAFANSEGGQILVGIKNDGSLSKAKITEKSQTDITDLFINFKPKITVLISFEIVPLDTFRILIITVKADSNNTNSYNSYKNTFWKRVGASTKDITEEIINKFIAETPDWSAQVCEGATIEDLDEVAIQEVKLQTIKKAVGSKKDIYENCKTDIEFLDKARLTINGQITNAAMVLIGKEERATVFIQPSGGLEIVWADILTGQKREGGKFFPPFALSVDKLIPQIRIAMHSYMVRIAGTITSKRDFVPQYDAQNIREAINNCIAHQDYQSGKRIVMEERSDKLLFRNGGYSKLTDEQYEQMVTADFTPNEYRNSFLARAMDTIGMIEKLGTGQKNIFNYAVQNFLPLPDRFNNIAENSFTYIIFGTKIDDRFSEILQDKKDLDMGMIILLDKVQKLSNPKHEFYKLDKQSKKKVLTKEQSSKLKSLKLIEGRFPEVYLSLEIQQFLNNENKHDEDELKSNFRSIFETTILVWLQKHKDGKTKKEIMKYAIDNIPIASKMDQEKPQKLNSDIGNSLTKLKKEDCIKNDENKNVKLLKWFYLKSRK